MKQVVFLLRSICGCLRVGFFHKICSKNLKTTLQARVVFLLGSPCVFIGGGVQLLKRAVLSRKDGLVFSTFVDVHRESRRQMFPKCEQRQALILWLNHDNIKPNLFITILIHVLHVYNVHCLYKKPYNNIVLGAIQGVPIIYYFFISKSTRGEQLVQDIPIFTC